MSQKVTAEGVLLAMRQLARQGRPSVSSTQVITATGGSSSSVRRLLDGLCRDGRIDRSGQARATRYVLRDGKQTVQKKTADLVTAAGPAWSDAGRRLRQRLGVPLAARDPVTYQQAFVDDYLPNKSFLLSPKLAEDLFRAGRMQGQQPAGTYARKVLEQLLIDLSWASSRLEGNRYSLLATEELFKSGASTGDFDAVMLLNHKSAIEFLVDAVPAQGLSIGLVRNLHAVLMQDLIADTEALGTIRNKVVNISDTAYVPMQVPAILEERLGSIVAKARLVKNPVEAAFFLWVNLAYLQPFEDGNKRTSRLAANIPLMLYNCAPLSFLDVDRQDYAQAMMGVYEFRDVSLAADLFDWTYRRSLKKYAVVLQSMGVPDPLRLRYRESLIDAVGLVVRKNRTESEAAAELELNEDSAPGFRALLSEALDKLEVFNCARYRLTMSATEAWIAAGRPR